VLLERPVVDAEHVGRAGSDIGASRVARTSPPPTRRKAARSYEHDRRDSSRGASTAPTTAPSNSARSATAVVACVEEDQVVRRLARSSIVPFVDSGSAASREFAAIDL
jgi:hypothetical protein